jgi:PEP-CTERM motif
VFSGIALEFLIDNITIGSASPRDTTPAIPEASTYAMLAFGLGAIALGLRRRRSAD